MPTSPRSQGRPRILNGRTDAVDRRVALLRGVNVGTAKRIAMADLRMVFEQLGYDDVRTVLNSGNVVFTVRTATSHDDAARIHTAIAERLRIRSRVVVLTRGEVADALASNPLTSMADDPSRLLVLALADAHSVARLEPLLKQRWTPEALALGTRVAYLWCARGIGISPLWSTVNRIAGDSGTARNIATMTRIMATLDVSG